MLTSHQDIEWIQYSVLLETELTPELAPQQKRSQPPIANPLILLARLGGLEPPTYGLEVRCSIQLSYRRLS